jgi:malate dehydrogenase (oxaloacetate-decarboxylating)(NADP+)
MMVEKGDADAFISGMTRKYSETIRPAMEIVGSTSEHHLAGMYMLITKKGPFFFADTTVNFSPSAEELVKTTLMAAKEVKRFNLEPRIALISYSNYGASKDTSPKKVRDAVAILHRDHPDLIVDGEMQANFALNKDLRNRLFPFSKLADKDVNTLIFPSLNSGNIAYKMMQQIGGAEVIGPILMGISKPIHIIQIESSVREIVDMTAIAVVDAQCMEDSECD